MRKAICYLVTMPRKTPVVVRGEVHHRIMRIGELKAYPVSVAVPPEHQVTLGIGRVIKRDARLEISLPY